jgi:hypothetical protein
MTVAGAPAFAKPMASFRRTPESIFVPPARKRRNAAFGPPYREEKTLALADLVAGRIAQAGKDSR